MQEEFSIIFDSWTTLVWTARVHLTQIFFNSKYYSTTQSQLVESADVEPRIERIYGYEETMDTEGWL